LVLVVSPARLSARWLAYLAANCPKVEATPLAGFDDWSRMVRAPLIWLGLPDPVKSMEDARALDPERAALRQRIDGLVEAFGVDKFTAADVYRKATATESTGTLLDGFARPDGKPISSKSIGNQLIKDLDRVSGGRWIERIGADTSHSGHQYKICPNTAEEAM
jgi:putative DNA primase/helicase